MRLHIFLATPCYGGVVTQGYMQSVIGLIRQSGVEGYDVTLALLGQDALITRCRNTLVAHFMATHVATHILFVDSDITFDPGLAGRLLRSDREVVAASYPLKTHYWDRHAERRLHQGEAAATAALRYVGELCEGDDYARDGDLAAARYVGTGFLLISRKAIGRMIEGYPETRYRTIHAYTTPHEPQIEPYALFDCMIDAVSQTYLSEDFSFCHRWRALVGRIWLDTRSSLTHVGPTEFQGMPESAFR